jgi:hypothetical protein
VVRSRRHLCGVVDLVCGCVGGVGVMRRAAGYEMFKRSFVAIAVMHSIK